MNQIVYDLSQATDFNKLVFINEESITDDSTDLINLNKTEIKLNNEVFKIVKYNKKTLNNDNIPTYGIYRSVIVNSDNKVVCFAPPKSINSDLFIQKYSLKDESLIAEEFVEGTMINLFWDYKNNLWELSTRNTVGCETFFYKSKDSKTFRTMFFEAATVNNLNFDSLDKNLCYSFVLQHPENRIVVSFTSPQLYLISVFNIVHTDENNIKVYSLDRNGFFNSQSNTTVKFPNRYSWTTYNDLIELYASTNTPYNILGFVVYNEKTGERTKLRNPSYETVKQLRGNQPKLQYHYLCLRKEGKVGDFLKYFPEYKNDFTGFRVGVHIFTNILYSNYISCYIKKQKPLIEFSEQYRTHMFNIHKQYLNELKEQKLFVTKSIVINYVNNIHPSLLMHCLNFGLKKV